MYSALFCEPDKKKNKRLPCYGKFENSYQIFHNGAVFCLKESFQGFALAFSNASFASASSLGQVSSSRTQEQRTFPAVNMPL